MLRHMLSQTARNKQADQRKIKSRVYHLHRPILLPIIQIFGAHGVASERFIAWQRTSELMLELHSTAWRRTAGSTSVAGEERKTPAESRHDPTVLWR